MHYSFKSTPTWTFKFRRQTITSPNQPGSRPAPNNYEVKPLFNRCATTVFPHSKRELFNNLQDSPPPGQYEAKSYIKDGPKRSISHKNILKQGTETPASNAYDNNTLKVRANAPKFSMGTKSKSLRQLQANMNKYQPSPTTYNLPDSKKFSAVIGNGKRKDLTETQKTPAPNYYQRQNGDFITSNAKPRCIMGKQPRSKQVPRSQTPGPATYGSKAFVEDNKNRNKGFAWINKELAQKLNSGLRNPVMSMTPGPGSYNINAPKTQAPRCVTSQAKRNTIIGPNSSTPYSGPGYHNVKLSSSKYRTTSACHFGKSERRPLDENQKTPGPNFYNSDKTKVLHSAPKYTAGHHQANAFFSPLANGPGPGSYNPELTLVKQSKQSTFISKEDFQRRANMTPGPGFYQLDKRRIRPLSFTKQRRVGFTDTQEIDKRNYEIPNKVVDPPNYMRVEPKIKYPPPAYESRMRNTGF